MNKLEMSKITDGLNRLLSSTILMVSINPRELYSLVFKDDISTELSRSIEKYQLKILSLNPLATASRSRMCLPIKVSTECN